MIKIAHEPSMPDTQASCDGKNIRKLPMPVSLVLQINRSPTSGEVKICLGSVGGCTSDVIRILNAAVAIHLMHAGVSAWAVLHLPRYIHQKALSRHASCQTACQSLLQKDESNKVQLVQEKVFGGAHRQKRKTSVWVCTGLPVPLSLSPLVSFPIVKKKKEIT